MRSCGAFTFWQNLINMLCVQYRIQQKSHFWRVSIFLTFLGETILLTTTVANGSVCMCVCTLVRECVYVRVCMCENECACTHKQWTCRSACIYVCMLVCVCVHVRMRACEYACEDHWQMQPLAHCSHVHEVCSFCLFS